MAGPGVGRHHARGLHVVARLQAILDDLVRTVDLPVPPVVPDDPAEEAQNRPREDALSPFEDFLSDEEARAEKARADELLAGPPPARLQGKGDLTLVIGFGPDAREAARILADGVAGDVRPVADRRDALAARADGVRRGCAVVAPVELEAVDAVPALAADLASLAPDQVWVAVDVSRRPEDTLHWVAQVDAVLAVDAIAATGAHRTASSHGLGSLVRPILWLDAPPA